MVKFIQQYLSRPTIFNIKNGNRGFLQKKSTSKSYSSNKPPSTMSSPLAGPLSPAVVKLFQDSTKDGLSITERISLQKEACRVLLESQFSSTYRVEMNMVQRQTLTIGHDNGEIVPSDYTSLSCTRRIGQGTSNEPDIHCLHFYSYPYKELSPQDLVRHLRHIASDLFVREEVGPRGCFAIGQLGSMISFLEFTKDAFEGLRPSRLDDVD